LSDLFKEEDDLISTRAELAKNTAMKKQVEDEITEARLHAAIEARKRGEALQTEDFGNKKA